MTFQIHNFNVGVHSTGVSGVSLNLFSQNKSCTFDCSLNTIFSPSVSAPAASLAAAWLAAQSRTCLRPCRPSPPRWPQLRPRRETARRTAATSTPPAVSARDRPATPAATRIRTTGRRGKAKCLKLPQKTRILLKNPVLFLRKKYDRYLTGKH